LIRILDINFRMCIEYFDPVAGIEFRRRL
jgi:hypothetical protein